jgi:Prion-inhibition and propagation
MPIEPIGLTLGAVGLAGLFSACVEYFVYVDTGRSYGRDLKILITKLEVEKTQLLIWGDAVGVLKPSGGDRNSQIDRPWVTETIERILGCIQKIFADTSKKESSYGLEPISFPLLADQNPTARVSTNRMRVFESSYSQFKARSNTSQRQTSIVAKARWAIHDRSKFQTMVSDLKELIDGLMDITPSIQPRAREMVQADINSLSNVASVRLVQEACADSHGDWFDTASLCMEASEPRILEW